MAIEFNDANGSIPKNSEFLKSLDPFLKARSKSRLFGAAVRPLTKKEIKGLESNGNHARDWKKISVHTGFTPDCVFNTMFHGACVLGVFNGKEVLAGASMVLPSGIYKSIIIDSEVGDNCCICNSAISNYLINDTALVHNVGSLSCSRSTSFGNGREIIVGIETGGREVLSFAEMTIPLAIEVCSRRNDASFLSAYKNFIQRYTSSCEIDSGVVESGSVLAQTDNIEDTYIGKNTTINGATLVKNCTILGSAEEPVEISAGAYVRNSCVQWGCSVTSMAMVDDSILTEHSSVRSHGKVSMSIIGPNTEIAAGEVTASLVGPFIGFHHQALLIAALWPEGKGNVGYGANVGSNHTSRAPDQEIQCGEGMFFGLGTSIKFPSDFTRAPYSIIATGVTTLPQRMEFPFSLINTPSEHVLNVPPAYNEIFPGWVLYENMYALKRNEAKFKARNKARRTVFNTDAVRPEIIDMMIVARNRLKGVKNEIAFYTDSKIPGLGKNLLTEKSRKRGIASYDVCIEHYCLRGLFRYVTDQFKKGGKIAFASAFTLATADTLWEHQRKIMVQENFAALSIKESLTRLIYLEEQVALNVHNAKGKDDVRGVKIFPDYGTVHPTADQDACVKEARLNAEKVKKEITIILKKLETL